MGRIEKAITTALTLILLMGCSGTKTFTSEDTALMIIDIQNAYLPVSGQRPFIANVADLLSRAREAGIPVIYIGNSTDFIRPSSPGWDFHRDIKPLEKEIVIEKRFPGAFGETELESILKEHHISKIIMTGLASSGCYGATARDAAARGFLTVVVSDGHADRATGKARELNDSLEGSKNPFLMMTEEIQFSSAPD